MGWFTKEKTQEQKMGDLQSDDNKLPPALQAALKEKEPQLSAEKGLQLPPLLAPLTHSDVE